MKAKIVLQDNTGSEEAEKMGIEFKPRFEYTDFWFRVADVKTMWVDVTCDPVEIVFSIGETDYRTPFDQGIFTAIKDSLA